MKAIVLSWIVACCACSSQVSLGTQEEVSDAAPDAPALDDHRAGDASPDATHYNGCLGKVCGVACTVCDPHDTACVEPPGSKQCNPHEMCVTALVCP